MFANRRLSLLVLLFSCLLAAAVIWWVAASLFGDGEKEEPTMTCSLIAGPVEPGSVRSCVSSVPAVPAAPSCAPAPGPWKTAFRPCATGWTIETPVPEAGE